MRAHAGAVIAALIVAQACRGEPTPELTPTPNPMHTPRQDDPGGDQKPGPLVRARPGAPVTSPSDDFLLAVVEHQESQDAQRFVGFVVRSPGGQTLLAPKRRFAAWFTVVIGWDAMDRVWARSGDIGVRVWVREGEAWREYVWQADGPPTPSRGRTIWDAETGEELPVIGGPLPEGL